MKVAAKEAVLLAKNAPKDDIEAVPQNNEQFFTFKPDTSLFAQETGPGSTAGTRYHHHYNRRRRWLRNGIFW